MIYEMGKTISLAQLYMYFSKLSIKDREYRNIPFELELGNMRVNKEQFFNILQKEIYAHSQVWVN